MINFRYHVVSIVAVFLALAIGIVLGSTGLRGDAIDLLTSANSSLTHDLHSSEAQNRALQQQVTADEAFAQADEARLLDGLLTGQRVVLVAAPGASAPVVSGVTAAAQKAGAAVTGQVNLQPRLLDASEGNQQFLSALVQELASPGTPPNGTALQQAARLLGSAILTKDPSGSASGGAGGTGVPASTRQDVLASYIRAGLLTVSGPLASSRPADPATLAVVVIPAAVPAGGNSDPANQGLITLARELNTAGLGTVMAGQVSGSGSGSAINALRSSSAATRISTVDDADILFGQIVTVQALAEALAGHKGGSYGEDDGSSAAGPSPAPSPTSTSTASDHAGQFVKPARGGA